MKEKLWMFIVKFLLISVPLFVLWLWKGQSYYIVFLNHVLSFIVIRIAGLHVKGKGFPFPAPIFIALIPFVSLMVITRGIRLKNRIVWLAEGLVIFFAWHMILTEAVYYLGVDSPAYEKFSVPLYLFSETLPFILWILFARKQVAGLFLRRKEADK